MKLPAIATIMLFCITGCHQSIYNSDPNGLITSSGKASTILAEADAQNRITAEGRTNEMQKYNPQMYVGFILAAVIGAVVWLKSRSSWLWIWPVSCVGGLALITLWSRHSGVIAIIIAGCVSCVAAWKLIEYQWERNIERDKVKKLNEIRNPE